MSLDLSSYYQVADPNSQDVGAFLAQLRQYDPNASYIARPQNAGGGEGGSGPSGTIYQLSVNPSKLPGYDGTGQLTNQTASTDSMGRTLFDPNVVPVNDSNKSIDPNQVMHSPIYGDVQNRHNVVVPTDHSWLDYSPLLVAGFGGLLGGFGAAAAGGLGGADAAGGAGFDFGAGAAGTDLGNAAGGFGGGGFDFGAGASGSDIGNSIGMGGDYGGGFQYGMGDRGLGTTLGSEAGTTGVLSPEEIAGLGPGNGFGMHDRGLGTTTGTEAGTTGVLSPSEIAGLKPAWWETLLNKAPQILQKLPGLLNPAGGAGAGGGSGGGGGGGNLLINAGQQQKPQTEDAAAILARLYGQHSGLLGVRNG